MASSWQEKHIDENDEITFIEDGCRSCFSPPQTAADEYGETELEVNKVHSVECCKHTSIERRSHETVTYTKRLSDLSVVLRVVFVHRGYKVAVKLAVKLHQLWRW